MQLDQVINGILTVYVSAQSKYKSLGQCTDLASSVCTFAVQKHKQSVSRYRCTINGRPYLLIKKLKYLRSSIYFLGTPLTSLVADRYR